MNCNQIASLEEALNLTTNKLAALNNPKIGFIGQRASDSFMFDGLVPIEAVICLDYGKDAEIIEKNTAVISLEKIIGQRKIWYSRQLKKIFNHSEAKQSIRKTLPQGSLLIPYSSNRALETFAEKEGYQLLNNPASLRDHLENKATVYEIKKELNLPNPSDLIKDLTQTNFNRLIKAKGKPLVIQTEVGSSGSGTFIIDRPSEFQQLQEMLDGQRCIVSPFIKGPTISVNALVGPQQIVVLAPAYQVIGNKETARSEMVFSGVDFGALQETNIRNQTKAMAERVGDSMRKKGYRGIFNLNILRQGMVLTDINARFMGSGRISAEIQLANGEIPLSLLHLMTFLDINFTLEETMMQKIFSRKEGSLIVLHSLEDQPKGAQQGLESGCYELT